MRTDGDHLRERSVDRGVCNYLTMVLMPPSHQKGSCSQWNPSHRVQHHRLAASCDGDNGDFCLSMCVCGLYVWCLWYLCVWCVCVCVCVPILPMQEASVSRSTSAARAGRNGDCVSPPTSVDESGAVTDVNPRGLVRKKGPEKVGS